MIAITYIGKNPGFLAKFGKKTTYDFEWQKSLGIGNRENEVNPKHASILSTWRDKRSGKKMFRIE